eukprot:scaffold2579_cov356-Prasinococcus_capsulatus_cf.AAC.3
MPGRIPCSFRHCRNSLPPLLRWVGCIEDVPIPTRTRFRSSESASWSLLNSLKLSDKGRTADGLPPSQLPQGALFLVAYRAWAWTHPSQAGPFPERPAAAPSLQG